MLGKEGEKERTAFSGWNAQSLGGKMSVFEKAKQAVHSAYMKTADKVLPTLSESRFVEEGVLTPEEFVAAGDLLVFKCKTWTWEAGDPDRAVPYLPKDKQFLLTRNVKCTTRCSALEASLDAPGTSQQSTTIKVESGLAGDDDEWVTPASDAATAKDEPVVEIGAPKPAPVVAPVVPTADEDDEDEDGPVPDMETFEGENLVDDDPARAKPAAAAAAATSGDTITKTRTYDLSITYDHYYRTPRVWLFGYDEAMRPLKPDQVFEDISADHAHKTVTMDLHPHLGIQHAYIHPCRHAAVMKKIIQRHVESGKAVRVDQYIILFIKFISSVIPTIEYDYTFDADAR